MKVVRRKILRLYKPLEFQHAREAFFTPLMNCLRNLRNQLFRKKVV